MSIIQRRDTEQVMVGDVAIGGGAPVSVQSMTNISAVDTDGICRQIESLAVNGAEIVRIAVPDMRATEVLSEIVERSPVPIVADVHFNPDIALAALSAGVDKLRLNPGNIRRKQDIWRIAEEALKRKVPIRVGVNSGSIPGDVRERYGGVNKDSMWVSARRHLDALEESGFKDIVLSLKSSDPMLTVEANRMAAAESRYPLHLGVTEAGPGLTGGVRSAVALSILLSEGIGDTIRVSLSGSPEMEPVAAWEILSSLGLRRRYPRIISCPTCARARLDVGKLASSVQEHLRGIEGDITVAVMGCEVNGPGEARDADIAIIGTPSGIQLFIDGVFEGEVGRTDLGSHLDEVVDSYIKAKKDTTGGSNSGGKENDQDSA